MKEEKVLLCGDSISKGIIYDNSAKKYKRVDKALSDILEKIFRSKVLNISGFGNTVLRAEGKFYRTFDAEKPDLVIFGLGGNDCDFDWNEVSREPDGIHKPKTDIEIFKGKLALMADRVFSFGKRVVLMNLPPLDPERYFNWISGSDELRKRNILKWLGSVSQIHWWQERYNTAVLEVAKSKDAELIDVRSEFLRQPDFRNCICEDGIHPNEKGQELIAKAVAGYFNDKRTA
ncbi:MAG: SGNH/GDSL hydrolase family protein [Clostridia bacterium]|nr:SGNH/GDSL hydrolase family protein [Clostridia bacterium]